MTVQVRKLVWHGSDEWGWWKADAAFGRWYFLTRDPYEDEPPIALRSDWIGGPERRYHDFDAARIAVQADFDDRARSLLDPAA